MKNKFGLGLFIVLVLVVTLACNAVVPKKNRPANQAEVTAVQAVEATEPAASEPAVAEPAASEPAASEPAATEPATTLPAATLPADAAPSESADDEVDDHDDVYVVGDPFFVQEGTVVSVIFLVKNPDKQHIINGSPYEVTVFDADGQEIITESSMVDVMMPGQKLGQVYSIYLEEGKQAASVTVSLTRGVEDAIEVPPVKFKMDNVIYRPDEYQPKVTGIITNNLDRTVTDLRVVAVTYDADGKINGGGYNFLDFLTANGTTGKDVQVMVQGEVARTEMFVLLSSFSLFADDNSRNETVKIFDYGFSQYESTVNVGIIVQNTNKDLPAHLTQYHLTAYDKDGMVLDADGGFIYLIFAGEQAGLVHRLYLPEGLEAHRVEIELYSGKPDQFDLLKNPFNFETAEIQSDGWAIEVTGEISSRHTKAITYPDVVVIAYDANGKIIGGGSTALDSVPARGKASFEVYLDLNDAPEEVSVFTAFTSMTSIQP